MYGMSQRGEKQKNTERERKRKRETFMPETDDLEMLAVPTSHPKCILTLHICSRNTYEVSKWAPG